jgi:hypothetical protein
MTPVNSKRVSTGMVEVGDDVGMIVAVGLGVGVRVGGSEVSDGSGEGLELGVGEVVILGICVMVAVTVASCIPGLQEKSKNTPKMIPIR